MNLTFGVCWIEDQASSRLKAAVERAVRGNGFEPEVEFVISEQDIQSFAQRQHHFQDYDLILLDLRLGNDRMGDALAPRVRRHFRSTPIVFYSAVAVPELRRRMAERGIDGVYCTSRRYLAARVDRLISDLTPALNRLSGMRGLAAQVVAECDEEFRRILIHLAELRHNETVVVESLQHALTSSHRRQAEHIAKVASLQELLASPAVSSGLLFDEVSKRVRQHPDLSDEAREARLAIANYGSIVLKRRNVLSHALEERTESGWVINPGLSKSGLTADDFATFRSDFLSTRGNIRRLRELLVSQ